MHEHEPHRPATHDRPDPQPLPRPPAPQVATLSPRDRVVLSLLLRPDA